VQKVSPNADNVRCGMTYLFLIIGMKSYIAQCRDLIIEKDGGIIIIES
jgi:hypothetical protein